MKQRFECICFHFVRTDSIMALRSRGMGTIRGLFPVGARDTPDNLTSCCFHAIIVNINENMVHRCAWSAHICLSHRR